MNHKYTLYDLSDTLKLAHQIAKIIEANFIISLNGTLGAGKTTLTREILRCFGVTGSIKSPTFTLVEPYEVNDCTIYHFDLYRFTNPDEWFDSGFDEYFAGKYICFIEWAEKAIGLIPQIDWRIDIEFDSSYNRLLTIEALTEVGQQCLMKLITSAEI